MRRVSTISQMSPAPRVFLSWMQATPMFLDARRRDRARAAVQRVRGSGGAVAQARAGRGAAAARVADAHDRAAHRCRATGHLLPAGPPLPAAAASWCAPLYVVAHELFWRVRLAAWLVVDCVGCVCLWVLGWAVAFRLEGGLAVVELLCACAFGADMLYCTVIALYTDTLLQMRSSSRITYGKYWSMSQTVTRADEPPEPEVQEEEEDKAVVDAAAAAAAALTEQQQEQQQQYDEQYDQQYYDQYYDGQDGAAHSYEADPLAKWQAGDYSEWQVCFSL